MRSTVTNGLFIRFRHDPPLAAPPIWAGRSNDRLTAIAELEKKGAIVKCSFRRAFCSHVLLVPKNRGTQVGGRLVKAERLYCASAHPILGAAASPANPPQGVWMASLDIKDAYLHVPMHPSTWKYLCFQARDQLYHFRCLPFGLNIAPLAFTAVLRHLLGCLHTQGINVLAYLDDLVVWADSPEACSHALLTVASTFQEHGFLIHHQKSCPTPSQQVEWLGFLWNSVNLTAALSTKNRQKLHDHCLELLQRGTVSFPEARSLLGRVAFAAQLLPNIKVAKRTATPAIRTLPKDGALVPLPAPLRELCHFLSEDTNLMEQGTLRVLPPSVTLWTDASLKGWGFHDAQGRSRSGQWSQTEAQLHINELELITIDQLAIASDLAPRHQTVAVVTDSAAAFYTCKKAGSIHSPRLHSVYLRIHQLLRDKRIQLAIRRIIEWAGPLEVDLMATPFNAKLPQFVCPFRHPAATAVDALTTPWDRWSSAFIFPPSRRGMATRHAVRGHDSPCNRAPAEPPFSPPDATNFSDHRAATSQLPPFQWVKRERLLAPFSESARWSALLL